MTGMGAVTDVGTSVPDFWDSLIHGRSGIARNTLFDPTNYPVQIAGEVKERDILSLVPVGLPQCRLSHCPHRAVQMIVVAASQAVLEAGLDPLGWDPRRIGILLGNGIGTMDFDDHAKATKHAFMDRDTLSYPGFMNGALEVFDPQHELECEADVSINAMAAGWNIQGPCSIALTACAASSQAIGEACHWIGRGDVEVAITGGGHSIVDPFGMTGFGHLTALSTRNHDPTRASRPFDLERDGFVLAEGAGILILESEKHARNRGAEILAEISGYGLSTDAYRVTDPEPDGPTCLVAMEKALESAGVTGDRVDLVNAHGTSTQANDRTETVALKKLFGERAYKVPAHSIKSMIGHAITAAGGLEAITSVLTLREGIVPPTINQESPDPECDLDYVPNAAREMKTDVILSNSFGFGGQNVALVIRRYE